jgi:hypothetical protein
LRDWRPLEELGWKILTQHPNAIKLLEQNKDKIVWILIGKNPNATYMIEEHLKNNITDYNIRCNDTTTIFEHLIDLD